MWWNKRLEEVTGLSPAELSGKLGIAFFPPEDQAAIAGAIAQSFQEGQGEVEGRLITPEGLVPYHFRAVSLKDNVGNVIGITGVGHDISERKRAEGTIRHLAYHNALTGLPNRILLQDRLTMALAQAQRSGQMLAVLFVDLDRFKLINDTLGHAVGDRLLQGVSTQLKKLLREGDTVARVGGDEFVLLLPAIDRAEHAVEVAYRILQKLRQPRRIGGQEIHATASIGVTIYPADGANAEALLSNADIAPCIAPRKKGATLCSSSRRR